MPAWAAARYGWVSRYARFASNALRPGPEQCRMLARRLAISSTPLPRIPIPPAAALPAGANACTRASSEMAETSAEKRRDSGERGPDPDEAGDGPRGGALGLLAHRALPRVRLVRHAPPDIRGIDPDAAPVPVRRRASPFQRRRRLHCGRPCIVACGGGALRVLAGLGAAGRAAGGSGAAAQGRRPGVPRSRALAGAPEAEHGPHGAAQGVAVRSGMPTCTASVSHPCSPNRRSAENVERSAP